MFLAFSFITYIRIHCGSRLKKANKNAYICLFFMRDLYKPCILHSLQYAYSKEQIFFLYHTPKSIVTHIYSFLAQNQSASIMVSCRMMTCELSCEPLFFICPCQIKVWINQVIPVNALLLTSDNDSECLSYTLRSQHAKEGDCIGGCASIL